MPPAASSAGRLPARPGRIVLVGGLIVGVLDITDALIFFGLRGTPPIRIFQSISSGLLGRASFTGGLATALLGAIVHFFIATVIVATYYLASRRVGLLIRHAGPCGILYGVMVYAVMNLVVVPHSAAAHGTPTLPVFLNGLAIHMFGVGLPSALVVRWGQEGRLR